jgi:hypothetical protein
MGSYQVGIALVVAFITAIFLGIAVLDVYFHAHGSPSVGYRVQRWSRRNQVLSAALILVLFTLLTHFLANPVAK